MRVLQAGSAFALIGIANASVRRWTFPDCEEDNCYRAFINEQYKDLAPSFCLEFLASTTTDPSVIPTPFKNCDDDVNSVSSACSCITYILTHTSASSTPEVTPTSSTLVVTTPTETPSSTETPSTTSSPAASSPELPSTSAPESTSSVSIPSITPTVSYPPSTYPAGSYPVSSVASSYSPENSYPAGSYPVDSSSSPVYPSESASSPVSSCETEAESTEGSSSTYWSLSTSTIYATTVYTVTTCASTVANCPATSAPYVTSETYPVTVTVFPVNPPSSYPVWTGPGANNATATAVLPTSKGVVGPTKSYPSSSEYNAIPTAAAARVGLNEVVLAAGALAIALI
ncbi:hypothetical protein F5Y08DRAFT_314408 [Xylaria arbuscula]|nr:hypothetical protein F5Y08DRAFT_314408 [Xylaria arbuscula]